MTLGVLQVVLVFSLFLMEGDSRPMKQRTHNTANSNLLRRTFRFINYGYRRVSKDKKTRNTDDKIPSTGLHSQKYLKDVKFAKVLFRPRGESSDEVSGTKITDALLKLKPFTQYKTTELTLGSGKKQIWNVPHCGVKDFHQNEQGGKILELAKRLRINMRRRVRRYVMKGGNWPKSRTIITWNIPIGYFSKKMTVAAVKASIEAAFRTWAEFIPFVFRWEPVNTKADIVIIFAEGYHGDSKRFDGAGGELAHAFYPNYGGNIHFDDAEPWTAATSDATHKSLLKVAIHEIGHSLGLGHSTKSPAVMNPVYSMGSNGGLGEDDIKGIQSIYGLCDPFHIDAIESYMHNGMTYIFNGSNYWRYDDYKDRAAADYPLPLNRWTGIPNNIDEAFLWGHNWKYYFFKGPYYYKYNDMTDSVEPGYPRLISSGWPGLPASDIDAAFTFENNISYFFKGELCYKFNNILDKVDPHYPKKIADIWPGAPINMDTAFRWYGNGVTYFFKGENYWWWDAANIVTRGPQKIKNGWKNICHV